MAEYTLPRSHCEIDTAHSDTPSPLELHRPRLQTATPQLLGRAEVQP